MDDIETILEMAMKFVKMTDYDQLSNVDDIKMLIQQIVESPHDQRIIILDDFGFIAGQATRFPFGPDTIASEIAWWIDPEARGENKGAKLMEAFEYWAKEIAKCRLISMTSLDKNVEKIYKRKGYKLYERAYMKVL
jgi:GNAT superfamily N-acetyltransferase